MRDAVKLLLIVPLAMLGIVELGHIACRLAGIYIDTHELLIAGVVNVIAAEAALVPLWLARHHDAAILSQVGLAATVIQMMTCVALAVLARLGNWTVHPVPFAWWLMAFYGTGLVLIATMAIRQVRAAATPAHKAPAAREDAP